MENYFNDPERNAENNASVSNESVTNIPVNDPPIDNDSPASGPASSPANETAREEQWSYTPNFILPQPASETAKAQNAYTAAQSADPVQAEPQPAYKKPHKPKNKKSGMALMMAACVLLSALAGFAGGWAAGKLNTSTPVIMEQPSAPSIKETTVTQIRTEEGLSYSELAAAVSPTVVQITTEYTVENFWMQQTATGAGSGVIISADGTIVTNHHVVENATRVKVILSTGDEYDAALVASDAQTDIAVLKIEAADLPYAVIGNSDDLVVGQEVVAVGNPLGELGGTVTNGIISALERQITVEDYTMTLLQTNTAINPGNSGGGLFDAAGKLIGIVNAKYSDSGVEGLGFAIPINIAMKSAQDLIDVGYVTGRVSVGLQLLNILDQQTAFQYRVSKLGVYVYSVSENTSAERAGFRTGDRIASVAGIDVYSNTEVKDIFNNYDIGDVITVVVERGDEVRELQLELTEYVPASAQAA